jgi:hypothetical protein
MQFDDHEVQLEIVVEERIGASLHLVPGSVSM